MSKKAWSAGYTSDITYTHGYYGELNPCYADFVIRLAGFAVPPISNACELGFGQGVSLNVHAAASDISWWGTDFNSVQANFAKELANSADSGCNIFDQSFSEFLSNDQLPNFDFIGLHGIWSWVSRENRDILVEFIRRHLSVGGVLYISYNTFPGWSSFAPLRQLMNDHFETLGSEGGGVVSRIDSALEFAHQLLESNPRYLKINPSMEERLKTIREQKREYLAHEFFNRDWNPMYFSELAKSLTDIRLDYVASANLLDRVDVVNLSEDQRKLLDSIPNRMLRETARDFMFNQQFRRDYWIKGARQLTKYEQVRQQRELEVVLITHPSDIELKVTGVAGEAKLQEGVYNPLIELLQGQKVMRLGDLHESLASKNIAFGTILEATMILAAKGYLSPVAKHKGAITRDATRKLNTYLMDYALSSPDITFLASPITGGGIKVGRFEQMFLRSRAQGKKTSDEWARDAWATLAQQGERLLKDGTVLDTEEKNLLELTAQAKSFSEKGLNLCVGLGLA